MSKFVGASFSLFL